jgi:hypothetical protein
MALEGSLLAPTPEEFQDPPVPQIRQRQGARSPNRILVTTKAVQEGIGQRRYSTLADQDCRSS